MITRSQLAHSAADVLSNPTSQRIADGDDDELVAGWDSETRAQVGIHFATSCVPHNNQALSYKNHAVKA